MAREGEREGRRDRALASAAFAGYEDESRQRHCNKNLGHRASHSKHEGKGPKDGGAQQGTADRDTAPEDCAVQSDNRIVRQSRDAAYGRSATPHPEVVLLCRVRGRGAWSHRVAKGEVRDPRDRGLTWSCEGEPFENRGPSFRGRIVAWRLLEPIGKAIDRDAIGASGARVGRLFVVDRRWDRRIRGDH